MWLLKIHVTTDHAKLTDLNNKPYKLNLVFMIFLGEKGWPGDWEHIRNSRASFRAQVANCYK